MLKVLDQFLIFLYITKILLQNTSVKIMRKRLLSPEKHRNNHKVEKVNTVLSHLLSYQSDYQSDDQTDPVHLLRQNINNIIAKTTTASAILSEMAGVLGSFFDVDCCLISLVNDISQDITVAHWCDTKFTELSTIHDSLLSTELLDNLPTIQCAGEKLSMEDVTILQKTLLVGYQDIPLSMKSILAICTKFGDRCNGVISLIKFQPYKWTDSQVKLLHSIDLFCAVTFAQILQLERLSTQNYAEHKSTQHQNLIKELTDLNRSNLELDEMLYLVIESTAKSLEVDRGLAILLKYADPLFKKLPHQEIPKAKAILMAQWTSSSSDTLLDNTQQLHSFSISDCTLSQMLFTQPGKAIMTNNLPNIHHSKIAALFAVNQFPSTLLIPLESQGKVLGMLVLQQEIHREWDTTELNLLAMVGTHLGDAIIQAQTLRQVQNLVDERTEQLKRSLQVQAKLYERTKQYVEQLQQLNDLKDEFVSNISDRLRYPLTNMLMSIRNLRLPNVSPERQERYLDILESECTKEINLINDLLTLQKLESHEEAPHLETIDLNITIDKCLDSFIQELTDKDLSVSIQLPREPLHLKTELESFDRIIKELLTNVCKYSEHHTTVRIKAEKQVQKELNQVMIKITNIGPGISEEEAAYIFDKFRRGKGRWIPGMGLGLALVKSLVQHLGGEIFVESIPIVNSPFSEISFTLALPLQQ